MSYTLTAQDKGVGKSIQRVNNDALRRWAYCRDHWFDTEIDTTAVSLNALLNQTTDTRTPGGDPLGVLQDRMGVIITNNHAAATLYIGFSSATSSTNYKYALAPGEATPFLPIGIMTIYLIGSGANTVASVTEFA